MADRFKIAKEAIDKDMVGCE